MDEDGNVLIRRTGMSQISVLAAADTGDRRQADMLSENYGHMLGMDRTVTLFEMNKFQKALENSLRYKQGRAKRQQLELQVLSVADTATILVNNKCIAVHLNSVPHTRG